MWEEGTTQERWHPPAGWTGKRFYTEKMVTFLQSLAWGHTTQSLSLFFWLLLSHHTSTRAQYECFWASESVHSPFKMISGFPAAFCLTARVGIPAVFNSQMLWKLFFSTWVFWPGEPWDTLLLWRGGRPRWPKYPSWFSSTTHRYKADLFHISVIPTTLEVASSLYLQLYNSVHLVFGWFSRLTVLWFSCSFNVVMGRGMHIVYLLYHLRSSLRRGIPDRKDKALLEKCFFKLWRFSKEASMTIAGWVKKRMIWKVVWRIAIARFWRAM